MRPRFGSRHEKPASGRDSSTSYRLPKGNAVRNLAGRFLQFLTNRFDYPVTGIVIFAVLSFGIRQEAAVRKAENIFTWGPESLPVKGTGDGSDFRPLRLVYLVAVYNPNEPTPWQIFLHRYQQRNSSRRNS